jgi:hypothetical protein
MALLKRIKVFSDFAAGEVKRRTPKLAHAHHHPDGR